MVPFAVEMAIEMHALIDSPHSLTVVQCASSLMDFYMLMLLNEWHHEEASFACRKFCTLYAALSREAATSGPGDRFWRVKPKFHMFSELAEYKAPVYGNPSEYWNYMDEDFVGWVAALASSRGGPKSAATTAKNVIDRYRALLSL